MVPFFSLNELEPLAQAQISRMAFDYIVGGADDEWTLRENQLAFERWQLLPRVLVDVTTRNLATTVLGTPVALPVLVAPMAFHGLVCAEAECATARVAAQAGSIMIASTVSNRSLEEIAAAAPDAPRWFQLYVYKDREVTRSMVERAVAAGYQALCVTVDTPLVGKRRRDMRNSFTLPPGLVMGNLAQAGAEALPTVAHESGLAAYMAMQRDTAMGWEGIDWLRSISPLPVVLKGIMHPDDARLAVEHGAAGIVVSNHGGRQLDGAPASLTLLPHIAEAVGDQLEVLFDGGVRRGTDVVKALALGARAVLLGRPVLWGLAVGAEAGGQAVFDLLKEELDLAMVLTGSRDVREISRSVLWNG